ncbi:hypothetical protein G9A89_006397 [Geosiphon pyriformis]|nr:hypothetical protein G9A89_006397 [Geosiphon pyriformis]
MTRAKSKKVANVIFLIVTNKVSTQEGLLIIETARQNILAIFLLKNISALPLAGSSFPVKVSSKRHTWVSLSVVSTTSKSPKIFNNRPVNKLVFSTLTTSTTTTTISTASQMTVKAKNSKKQQQAVTTAMVTPNSFVVPDEIFGKISTAAASPFPDMDDNNSSTSPKMGQDQLLAVLSNVILFSRLSPISVMKMESTTPPLISGAADGNAWKNVNGLAFNLVSGATFKIKMALLSFLFQLLPGCIGIKFVSQDAKSLNGATKVAIGNKIFLTTHKIAWFSNMASVSSLPLSVVLYNVPLGIFSDDIKSALGIFGVVISVKLKPAGLWQYAVVHFKNTSFAVAALTHWSVLVRKDSVKILLVVNQNNVISSRDTFKAKLVNLSFGCIVFEISDLCQDLTYLAIDYKRSPFLPPKLSFNTSGGSRVFKPSFAGSKFYAKAAAFVVFFVVAAAEMNLDLGGLPKTTTPMLPVVSFAFNIAVEFRLASLEFHLSKLSVLIKFLVESVGALVVLVTKLLFTLSAVNALVKKCVAELAKQNKDLAAVAFMMQKKITHFEKKCEWVCLENASDNDDMVDDDDNNVKDFSVYDNTFNVMIYFWKNQPSSIKFSPNQTAKWISSMVKNSYELVSIMGKMYKLDMFDILNSKDSTSM